MPRRRGGTGVATTYRDGVWAPEVARMARPRATCVARQRAHPMAPAYALKTASYSLAANTAVTASGATTRSSQLQAV